MLAAISVPMLDLMGPHILGYTREFSNLMLVRIVILTASCVLAYFRPFLGGIAFLITYLVSIVVIGGVGFAGVLAYGMAIMLVSNGWWRTVITFEVFTFVLSSSQRLPQIQEDLTAFLTLSVFNILVDCVALGIGFLFYTARTRLVTTEAALAKASERIRYGLAADLHDTVARDLSAALVLLRSNPSYSPQVARDLEGYISEASSALRTIVNGYTEESFSTLTEVVHEVKLMLAKNRIKLVVQCPPERELPDPLTSSGRAIATLIREAGVNIVKYAPMGSSAELNLSIEDDIAFIQVSSKYVAESVEQSQVTADPLSSKFGLSRLYTLFSNAGGDLTYGPNLNTNPPTWVVSAEIPLDHEHSIDTIIQDRQKLADAKEDDQD